VLKERAQSIFSLEAGLAGFDSSVIRLALVVTAWNMFQAHPLLGIGLKNFETALPLYAPTGMPLAVEMGPDHVLTVIQGPHSTYLSLLSELGLVGLIAFLCWELSVARRIVKCIRRQTAPRRQVSDRTL